MGWLPDFELDEEDVLDPNIWEAASYDELTYFGIEDFRHNDWEWEVWLNEPYETLLQDERKASYTTILSS